MCRHLRTKGCRTALIEHPALHWHPPAPFPEAPGTTVVKCPGPVVTEAEERDVAAFAETYRQVVPAVFLPNWSPASFAACARLTRDMPQAVRVFGVGHSDSDEFYDDMAYYESVISLFLAPSEEVAAAIKRRLPQRQDDVVMRPYAVESPAELSRDYAASGRPLRMVYVGRIINHQKRMAEVAPLMLEMAKRHVDFTIRIIGEGGYKEWLRKDVSQLPEDLRRRIRIEDPMPLEELDAVWRDADVSFALSEHEGVSLSMIGAMAQGCVPVFTAVSGATAAIRHGENGYLVAVGDLAGFAEAMAGLHRDRALLQRLGRQAYETVRDRYSYDQYVAWFLGLVERAWRQPDRAWDPARPLLPDYHRPAEARRERGFPARCRAFLRKVVSR